MCTSDYGEWNFGYFKNIYYINYDGSVMDTINVLCFRLFIFLWMDNAYQELVYLLALGFELTKH